MSVPSPRRPHHTDEPVASSWCEDAVPKQGYEVLAEVYRWTVDALTSGPEVPIFGSAAWCALPDGPTKTHSAVLAALAWWTEQWARSDAAAAADVASSHAISTAENWRAIARDHLARPTSYIPRRQ